MRILLVEDNLTLAEGLATLLRQSGYALDVVHDGASAEALAAADLTEQLEYLEPEESAALAELVRLGGRAPVAVFSRDHGEVRAMGPGRLEREEP